MFVYNIPGVGALSHGKAFTLGGIKYPPNWLQLATEGELDALGITVEEVVAPDPEPPTAADLGAYLASKRYEVEVGGIVVGGMPCWTDRETQFFLDRILASLDRGFVTAPLKIKTPAGSLSLTTIEIEGLCAAVAQHVQTCFDLEANLADAIGAGTITAYAEIEAADWPPNS